MPAGKRYPGGRNIAGRVQFHSSSVSSNNVNQNVNLGTEEKKNVDSSSSRVLSLKHVPMPSIPVDSQLTFEVMSLVISIVAVCLQLLNLYRSIWWLPQSYNDYSMNFYLIDHYLLIFIVTMLARRLIYVLIRRLMDNLISAYWQPLAQRTMRIVLLKIIIGVLSWCLYNIYQKHNPMKIFYLVYPSISVYFLMFGITVGPFFDISTAPLYVKEDRKSKFILDKPLHNCSLNAPSIRAEVSTLKTDFNRRLKRALFASSVTAYLCGIAPILFVTNHLHFDIRWVAQHALFFWLGQLSAHFVQAYPVRYCDVLHRSALHLGRWYKLESRNNHVPVQSWNDAILWPNGSLVRYNKELYRSEGLCTAAEPGNSSHYRFYTLFSNPSVLICTMLCLQVSLMTIQLVILYYTVEWYKVLSMTLLAITNYHTLFKLARDYLVCWKVYHVERIVQEKTQSAVGNVQ